jgi:hypothetical protein
MGKTTGRWLHLHAAGHLLVSGARVALGALEDLLTRGAGGGLSCVLLHTWLRKPNHLRHKIVVCRLPPVAAGQAKRPECPQLRCKMPVVMELYKPEP